MYECSEARMQDKISTMSKFGDAGHGGITRYSLSPEALQARGEFIRRMEAIGAEIKTDDVACVYATLKGSDPFLKNIVMASHCDSVKNGGNYDGILGVMGAMEVLETIAAENIPLDILYEDEDILVLNKPADMPVHPSAGNYENTLANGVAWYYRQQGETFVYRCINRLDRDTTGVLVLAKNPLSGALLSTQMKQRRIRRTYLALTDGIPPEKGTVRAPIARVNDSVITREVNFERGEPAVTHYERLAVSNGYALVELHLETGRTHQIRVHMNYIGCPLPGDFLYHPVFDRIGRQALHSFQLEFEHPITKEPLRFLAPVPEDFRKAFTGS